MSRDVFKEKRCKLASVCNLCEEEIDQVVLNVRENVDREAGLKNKEWSEIEKDKFTIMVLERICLDYTVLQSSNVNSSLEIVLLKWGGYSKKNLREKVCNLVLENTDEKCSKQVKREIQSLNYNSLRNIYKDFMRIYDVVDLDEVEEIMETRK